MDFNFQDVLDKFNSLYSSKPLIVRSPGRINLIGEHTDYNDGFVMPAAIDHETIFAVAEATDGQSSIYSLMYDEFFEVDLINVHKVASPKWANYLLGVIDRILSAGHKIKPFKCVFGGNIPLGAGLSSSASMECGFAYALNTLNNLEIDKLLMVQMAQWAEHHYVGVKCGIMDQFASMMGAEGKVILLDCRSLEYTYAPLNLNNYDIVLCDTKVKHSLVDSEYNTRRSECESGVSILQQHYPEVKSLRDVEVSMLEMFKPELKGKVYNRCLYVVQEIKRVQEASKDLEQNNLKAFGQKMYETHEGLSKLYEVSCKELDFLVEQARSFNNVLGSRMMGGGFGGCTINIVPKNETAQFIEVLSKAYIKQFDHAMESYVVAVKDGTHVMNDTVEKVTLKQI